MQTIIPYPLESLWVLAGQCNALYVCPKASGRRMGPLVAYAGKDSEGRNLVGDIYFNFRRIESHVAVVQRFAEVVAEKIRDQGLLRSFDTICGIPQGGRTLGQALALVTGKRFVYADKKPKPTEPGKKQEYDWDLAQFEFNPGERVALAEDVCNNFQNTDHLLAAIAAYGVDIALIACALNRSPLWDAVYMPQTGVFAGRDIPVVASIREVYPEYRQDDPRVTADVAAGNVEFQVKKNWARLRAFMQP